MIYSVNTTSEFTAKISIGTGVRAKDGKEYIYCELTYSHNEKHIYFTKKFPAEKFHKVCRVYNAINNGLIPVDEIVQTISEIR